MWRFTCKVDVVHILEKASASLADRFKFAVKTKIKTRESGQKSILWKTNLSFWSLNGQFASECLKPAMFFGNREGDLLSNYPCAWTDVCTFFSSQFFIALPSPSLLSLLLLCARTSSSTQASISFTLTFPNVEPAQRPLTLDITWRYSLFPSKARWWDCLGLNEPSLPQQMSSCISCRPVGFIDRSSPVSVGAGAGALSSSWSGCWRLLAPLAALFEALSGARLSSYPAPLQPRLRTLVRRLPKIDEKNPPVSPHRFPCRTAGWYSGLLDKDLPAIRSVGLPVLRVCSLEC